MLKSGESRAQASRQNSQVLGMAFNKYQKKLERIKPDIDQQHAKEILNCLFFGHEYFKQ